MHRHKKLLTSHGTNQIGIEAVYWFINDTPLTKISEPITEGQIFRKNKTKKNR